MSREFNGSTDLMTYNLGASGGVAGFTFGTVLMVTKVVTVTNTSWLSLIELEGSGADIRGALGRHNTGAVYWANHVASEVNALTLSSTDGWVLLALTKATGSIAATVHKIPVGGSRTSTAMTGAQADSATLAGGRIKLAGDDDPANIRLAVAAILPGIVLTTSQLDGIAAAKTTASILALTDANSWVVDDSNAFASDLKGNHNRSALSGTTNSVDNPAGWAYGLTSESAPVNAVAPAVTGTAQVGQSLTATPGEWNGSPSPAFTYQWQRYTP